MWLFDPVECVDGSQLGQPVPLNVVGDTIIMDLCSQPCDFLFYSDIGLCMVCFCGPLIPTLIPGPEVESSFSINPNPIPFSSPVLVLNTGRTGPHYAQVLDLAGRSLLMRSVNGGRSELELDGIPMGSYLLILRDDAGHMSTERFHID